jgi:hypothetical protein
MAVSFFPKHYFSRILPENLLLFWNKEDKHICKRRSSVSVGVFREGVTHCEEKGIFSLRKRFDLHHRQVFESFWRNHYAYPLRLEYVLSVISVQIIIY